MPAFPLSPHGLEEIVERFGDPNHPTFERDNIVLFTLPYPLVYAGQMVNRSRAHKKAVQQFQWALEQIQLAGLDDEVSNYGGIYAKRAARGMSKLSTHSWGIAIDVEPQKYPLGSLKRLPDTVVNFWRAAGFFYGGDFHSQRKDPMHFQLATGY